MKNCLIYMFSNKNNIIKFFIFTIFLVISITLINFANSYNPYLISDGRKIIFYPMLILSCISSILAIGYGVNCMEALIAKSTDFPSFDIKSVFINGIRFVIAFSLLFFIVAFIFAILGFISHFLVKNDLAVFAFIVAVISFLIVFMVLFNLIISSYSFVRTKNLLSFIRFKSNYNQLKEIRTGHYLIYTMIMTFAFLAAYFIKSALMFTLYFYGFSGLIIYALIISFIWAYLLFVYMSISVHAMTLKK